MMSPRWWASRAGTAALALLACQLGLAGCGRSSKSHAPARAGGTPAGAGQGGGAGRGGSGGTLAGNGAAGSATHGGAGGHGETSAGGAAGSTTGSAGTGGGGANGAGSGGGGTPASGGMAGEGWGTAGDGASGSGGASDCQDLCAPGAPACCTTELSCVSHVPSCRLDVLVGRVGVVYEYSELEAKIAALTGEVDFTIPDTDFEWAAADPAPAARFELHLTREASTANLEALTRADAETQGFRFVCDEQTLFLGVVYLIYGAAALQTPVLHVDDVENDAIVLKLGAWQGAWLLPTSADTGELRARLDRPELRSTFCARSALKVLEPQ